MDRGGDAQPARRRKRFDARGDVDRVPGDVDSRMEHVSQVNADSNQDGLFLWAPLVELLEGALDLDGAIDSLD